jgi:hypothetical protein
MKSYDEVVAAARSLPKADQARLLRELQVELHNESVSRRGGLTTDHPRTPELQVNPRASWLDYMGIAPYPLVGMDAQEWVTKLREESDRTIP